MAVGAAVEGTGPRGGGRGERGHEESARVCLDEGRVSGAAAGAAVAGAAAGAAVAAAVGAAVEREHGAAWAVWRDRVRCERARLRG